MLGGNKQCTLSIGIRIITPYEAFVNISKPDGLLLSVCRQAKPPDIAIGNAKGSKFFFP
jgi:hypothetical protein